MKALSSMRTPSILLLMALLSSCARHHLTLADSAYDRMAYASATSHYEKALQRTEDRKASLRAADAYRHRNMFADAARHYAQAERMDPLQAGDALRYGQVMQALGRIADARRLAKQASHQDPTNPMALALHTNLNSGIPQEYPTCTVTPIALQGMAGAFSAFPIGDGILFVGEKEVSSGDRNPWTGGAFLDLYTSTQRADGTWSQPMPLKGEVNGRYHEGPMTIGPGGRELFFTRSDYARFRLNKDGSNVSHLMLFRAERDEKGNWGNLHQFAHNGDGYSTGHPALSADGRTLYFISDRTGGLGGTDLYRCVRSDVGWSQPENLGPNINSAGDEMFPTLAGDTLHFASNGHRGLGGLDLFRSVRTVDGWNSPVNLGLPFNSTFDDFAFVPLGDGKQGYLSSNRTGMDRIHRFEHTDPELWVHGEVLDATDNTPLSEADLHLLDMTSHEELRFLTGPEGTFAFELRPESTYRLTVMKEGMFTESRDLSTEGRNTSINRNERITMRHIVLDKSMVVDNIYYDYDRWEIRPDAATELDKLVRLFNDNPHLSFELGAHTDSRAGDVYNLMLSEARAKSAVDYLVRRGIGPQRISARGYGESRLINHCVDGVECTEQEHQANRRTEIKVTSIEETSGH